MALESYAAARRWRLWLAVSAGLAAAAAAQTPYAGPLFDAHLHYNDEACGRAPSAPTCWRACSAAACARSSRTAGRTTARPLLADARDETRAAGVTVVPFVRLYRDRADYPGWFADASIHEMVLRRAGSGAPPPARTAGSASSTSTTAPTPMAPIARELMQLAQARDLVVLAHVDDVAIERLFAHAPRARLIWAHTGIGGVPVERVRALFEAHPTLYGRAVVPARTHRRRRRLGRAVEGAARALPGALSRRLRHLGQRALAAIRSADARRRARWLGELPAPAARRIAWENGAALFGLPAPAER